MRNACSHLAPPKISRSGLKALRAFFVYWDHNGIAPSHRDLSEMLAISESGARQAVLALLRDGFLEKLPSRYRGWRITEQGRKALGKRPKRKLKHNP